MSSSLSSSPEPEPSSPSSHAASPSPSHQPSPPPQSSKAGRFAVRAIGGLALAALLGWFGIRISEAVTTKKAEEAERTATAKSITEAEAKSGKKPGAGQHEGLDIRSVTGRPATWLPQVTIDGTLNPIQESELTFKSPGRVASVRARVGQEVRVGDVLAQLDSAEAQAQLDAARAQVRTGEAQLALVKDSATRVGSMVQKGAGSEAMGVEARGRETLGEAQLDGARAQLRLAETALRNHTLTAPFAGTVTRVPSGPGAVINPGIPGPALFHLSDTRQLRLVGTVAESDARLVKVGGEVKIHVDGLGGVTKTGKLVAVLGAVDPMTRRVPVEAEIDNRSDDKLLAGTYVRATLSGAAPQNVLSFPPTVIRPGSQDEVMVVDKGRLRARRVQFVYGEGGAIYVRAGLSVDDAVWLDPTNEAKDGDLAGPVTGGK